MKRPDPCRNRPVSSYQLHVQATPYNSAAHSRVFAGGIPYEANRLNSLTRAVSQVQYQVASGGEAKTVIPAEHLKALEKSQP